MGKIPELEGPAEIFYNEEESTRYTNNSRIQYIQRELTEKCLELLNIENGIILDVGCGSGISGSVLNERGRKWIGIDISKNMLDIAVKEEYEVLRVDIGEGLPFRPGMFSGVVSVSVLQWLFQSYKKDHHPIKRIRSFFTSLFSVCKPRAKCVFQFYLKNDKEVEILKEEALRAGFNGGIHTENPGTRNAKHFLVLENGMIRVSKVKKKTKETRIDRILKVKERRRRKGKEVPKDTKYTGRKRRNQH